ncbi:hypothetical protein [Lactobacillus selangorensis]|nr:hypothetical protein [Lactobacillus selangorensis]
MAKQYVFDIESLKHDDLVTFMTLDRQQIAIYHKGQAQLPAGDYQLLPDAQALNDFVKDAVLISFNGHQYDDYVLAPMLADATPEDVRAVSDKIIHSHGQTFRLHLPRIANIDLDTHADDHRWSLKSLESQMGLNIEETAIDFNREAPLTADELAAEVHYNINDVKATAAVYAMRRPNYFDANAALIKAFKLPRTAYNWGQGALVRNVLVPAKEPAIPKWPAYETHYCGEQMLNRLPEIVRTAYQAYFNGAAFPKVIPVELGRCELDFSLGGLHGVTARSQYQDVQRVDIQSMYPTLIIQTNALGDAATQRYAAIYKQRLQLKATNPNDPLNTALKLVLNRTSGLMDARFEQKVANPLGMRSLRIIGQAVTYELAAELYHAGYQLLNVNTDGLYFTGAGNGTAQLLIANWEQRYHFTTAQQHYQRLIQKDVNNYFTLDDDQQIAVHGGDVGRYFGFNYERASQLPAIIDRAIVDHLLFDQPLETILSERRSELFWFAFNVKVAKNYQFLTDADGTHYQKVDRLFAVTDGKLYRQENTDGKSAKIRSLPESAAIENANLESVAPNTLALDLPTYQALITKHLKGWQKN